MAGKMRKPFFQIKSNGVSSSIYHSDAVEFLDDLPDESADIIFVDPPFNIGKQYDLTDFNDKDDPDVYLGWLTSILRRSLPKLKLGASLYVYHLPSVAYHIAAFLDGHLLFRHWIAVSMKNNFARGQRLYPAHYALLYFTRGAPRNFSRPKILPKACRHCGELVKDYGG